MFKPQEIKCSWIRCDINEYESTLELNQSYFDPRSRNFGFEYIHVSKFKRIIKLNHAWKPIKHTKSNALVLKLYDAWTFRLPLEYAWTLAVNGCLLQNCCIASIRNMCEYYLNVLPSMKWNHMWCAHMVIIIRERYLIRAGNSMARHSYSMEYYRFGIEHWTSNIFISVSVSFSMTVCKKGICARWADNKNAHQTDTFNNV